MSIPRKHHYLPRVHIRKFKTDKGYFLFFKDKNKLLEISSSENIFVTKDLNSTIDENTGEIDHKRVEDELTALWDNNFNYHYDNIINNLLYFSTQKEVIIDLIQDSLKFFFEYSIIGNFRQKKLTKQYNETTFSWFDDFEDYIEDISNIKDEITNMSKEEISSAISGLEHFNLSMGDYINKLKEKLKFPAPTITEVKKYVPSECSCYILLARDSSFILPDCTAMVNYSETKFKWDNFDVKRIDSIGIPIHPNIYLQIKNNEANDNKSTEIYLLDKERVNEINQNLARLAHNQFLTINNEIINPELKK